MELFEGWFFAKIWNQITLLSLSTIPLSQDFALGFIGQKCSKSTFFQHPKDVHIHKKMPLVEKNLIRKQCFSKLRPYHGCVNLFTWIRISCSRLQVQINTSCPRFIESESLAGRQGNWLVFVRTQSKWKAQYFQWIHKCFSWIFCIIHLDPSKHLQSPALIVQRMHIKY